MTAQQLTNCTHVHQMTMVRMMKKSNVLSRLLLVAFLTLLIDVSVADAFQVVSKMESKGGRIQKNNKPMNFADDLQRTSSLFQSDVLEEKPSTVYDAALATLFQSKLTSIPQETKTVLQKSSQTLFKILRKSWWCLPMMLALVPVYSALVLGAPAAMPSWWPLTKMNHILSSKYAALIVTIFLSSNIFYFIAGSYLLVRFSWRNGNNNSLLQQQQHHQLRGFPLLGQILLTAGCVSTVFHYFQALGSFHVAEALCYIDHAVAISGILYFWKRCGKPGPTASVLSLVGFVTLVMTGPGYAWLHSAWHGLSSVAAIFWAHDGVQRHSTAAAALQPVMVRSCANETSLY